jgi:uncharacterized metal-binding protein YceD (DUF177 family)
MKIYFKKIPSTLKDIEYESNSVKIEGSLSRISAQLVKLDSKMNGRLMAYCSRCGRDIELSLKDEEFNIIVSDGVPSGDMEDDVSFEFFDGYIDFEEIIQSELETIKSDYHICKDCVDTDDIDREF